MIKEDYTCGYFWFNWQPNDDEVTLAKHHITVFLLDFAILLRYVINYKKFSSKQYCKLPTERGSCGMFSPYYERCIPERK